MHFWIDKRSSNLHNYGPSGRGRAPGSGGFYSRTRHHPPPLQRSMSSNSSNNSSPSSSSSTSIPQGGGQPSSNYIRHQMTNNTTTLRDNSSTGPEMQINKFQNRFQGQPERASSGGGGNMVNSGQPSITHNSHHHPIAINTQDPAVLMSQNNSADNYYLRMYFGSPSNQGQLMENDLRSANAFRNLNGANRGAMNSHGRRPRSQGHSLTSAASNAAPGRRRSSSGSGNNSNTRRASMNRWTYDPYHLHHQSRSHHSQQWNDGLGEDGNPSGSSYTTPVNLSDLTQNNRDAPSTEANSSTSSHPLSVVDPAWKRTKRIGLTLCFMAFILLSTVAAKFIIEAPLLIDKNPRSERTEATIYFFLTELIFVVFAMALFFTGVTCLRKRTNAYLLRQFNQYIMNSSPHGAMGSTEYFHGHNNNQNSSSSSGQGVLGMHNMINNPQGADRPFTHYLPSLENHLMNMHITVAESANFGMGGGGCSGLSKPPPYHIALYLPVPDEPGSDESFIKDTDKSGHNSHNQSSSWISSSSCLAESNNDNDKTEDESDEEIEGGVPRRKRQKTNNEDIFRPETPPPPYGQI